MSADTRNYVLDISTDLFRLSTESLRLRSNETLVYATLESLIDSRAASSTYSDELKPKRSESTSGWSRPQAISG